jgi:autotransporter-associated beta strand protein
MGDATFDVENSETAEARLSLGEMSESGGARSLTKTGDGTLALLEAASYSGDTTILGGTLSRSIAELADGADVYLSTGSVFELLFDDEPDTIRSLFVDGVLQPGGTWGSPSSAATNTSELIEGPGLLFVSQGAVPVLVGDYNDDGDVNAADYTVWRNVLGEDVTLPNRDPLNMGLVNGVDYEAWKSNFGETSAEGQVSGLTAVPEPASGMLGLLAGSFVGALIGGGRRLRKREAP